MSGTDRQADEAAALGEALSYLNFAARRPYAFDLSHRAVRVLQFVGRSIRPLRIDDVAKLLDCAASTASELVKRLEKRGLLVRRRAVTDERVVEIDLTEAGHAALLDHTAVDSEALRLGLARLSAAERRSLQRLLERVTDGVVESRPTEDRFRPSMKIPAGK